MKHFDLLESRHHVKEYSDVIPAKELIEGALWKAWKTTPSKNSLKFQFSSLSNTLNT